MEDFFLYPQILKSSNQWIGKNFIVYNILFISISILNSKREYFLREMAIIEFGLGILIVLLILLFEQRIKNLFFKGLLYLKQKNGLNRVVFTLFGIIIVQRYIAISLDNNILSVDDDPNTFYQSALSLVNTGAMPNSVFSPGIVFFLALNFLVFGTSIVWSKCIIAFISILGLICLFYFTNNLFKSKTIALLVLVLYIFSNHYVSFGHLFWNENLFHPLLSIFLFSFQSLRKAKSHYAKILLIILISFISFYMTLLRSWFPLILIVFIFSEILVSKLLVKSSLVILLIFTALSFSYKKYIDKENTNPVVTSNMFLNFAIGNNPYSQGTYTKHYATYEKETGLMIGSDEMKKNLLKVSLENPNIVLKNITKKFILWFVGAGGPRPIHNLYQHPLQLSQYYYRIFMFLFFIYGFVNLFRHKAFIPLLAGYFAIFFVHLVFFADYRFTLTAMPIYSIVIAVGIQKFSKKIVLEAE